ncbi:MAG: ABC transporter substrate-binding protein [Candidatus Wallbacteria bacterium]|nr:ABC transporter substrate-binding protein [Candidatus Wallbacteria bacterium]
MRLLILIICFIMFLTGCGEAPPLSKSTATSEVAENTPDMSPAYGDCIIDTISSNPATLNPLTATESDAQWVIGLIYNCLVKKDGNDEWAGDLAERWEQTGEGKILTFHLKPGVKWHDGVGFNAEDVLFTYQKILDKSSECYFSDIFTHIDTVEVLDPLTIRITYDTPYAPALSQWWFTIIPKHILEKEDLTTEHWNRSPIGTGPFRFSEWIPDERIILNANDDYFDGKPFLRQYIIRITPDESMKFLSLQRGEIDASSLNCDQYTKHSDTEDFKKHFNIFHFPDNAFSSIAYNLALPKFQDRRIRQALTMAIDREQIIREINHGFGSVHAGPFSRTCWAYDETVKPLPYDPAGAKALLREAGWKETGEIVFFYPYFATTKLIAALIAKCWEEIGLNVKVESFEWTVFWDKMQKLEFEAGYFSWVGFEDPDDYSLIWETKNIPESGGNGYNFSSYKNSEVDRLFEEGRITIDPARRKEIYHKIHKIIEDEQPYTFVESLDSIWAVDKRFHGIVPTKTGIFYNIEKWYVPAELQRYFPKQPE